jgi:hypothetical protein
MKLAVSLLLREEMRRSSVPELRICKLLLTELLLLLLLFMLILLVLLFTADLESKLLLLIKVVPADPLMLVVVTFKLLTDV